MEANRLCRLLLHELDDPACDGSIRHGRPEDSLGQPSDHRTLCCLPKQCRAFLPDREILGKRANLPPSTTQPLRSRDILPPTSHSNSNSSRGMS